MRDKELEEAARQIGRFIGKFIFLVVGVVLMAFAMGGSGVFLTVLAWFLVAYIALAVIVS